MTDDDLQWINLMDIIGREGTTPGFDERRIAAFAIDQHGELHVREECDDWYSTTLTTGELARLANWLRVVQVRGQSVT